MSRCRDCATRDKIVLSDYRTTLSVPRLSGRSDTLLSLERSLSDRRTLETLASTQDAKQGADPQHERIILLDGIEPLITSAPWT
nr:hypothetical protein CFP56_44424 [Quercus suber]